jgi:hypothetical protein
MPDQQLLLLGQRVLRDRPLPAALQVRIDGELRRAVDADDAVKRIGALMKEHPRIAKHLLLLIRDVWIAGRRLEMGFTYDAATDTWTRPDGEGLLA